jgi:hypothetical protein
MDGVKLLAPPATGLLLALVARAVVLDRSVP